jgi:hypothetical protein
MDEFLKFLLPAVDGSIHSVLQLLFAVSFAVALIVVPGAVARAANSERWARNIATIEQQGAGPTAGTSVEQLANAAATPAERWADILPSLLLVFGLLGTFIGLGLALTEAADALKPGADALASLTPIMDSLGSKFKTSTWGIIAFLGLKIWFTFTPYDERRHAWAAARHRVLVSAAAEQARLQRDGERRELVEAIRRHGDGMQESQQRALQQTSEHHVADLAAMQQQTDIQKQRGERQLEQGGLQLHVLKELAAHRVEDVARDAIFLARLDAIAGHGAETAERLITIAEHSAASRLEMEEFSRSVRDNIAKMATAGDEMAQAAQAAGQASTQLGGAVGAFRDAMTGVLDEVKVELGQTIGAMGATFADNMGQMSASLKAATDGIRAAIETLSGGVTDTITQLQHASDEAAQRQEKARATFAASGETLMTNIAVMGDFMKEMQKQVEVGLKSISEASTRMLILDKQFAQRTAQDKATLDAVQGVAASMGDLVVQLDATGSKLATAGPLVDNIRALADAVAMQQSMQAATDERQHKLIEENGRALASVSKLAAAIAELSLARREEAGGALAGSGQGAQ